jgi:hypothetical protein
MQHLVEEFAPRPLCSRGIAAAIWSGFLALMLPAAWAQSDGPCTLPPTLLHQPDGRYKLDDLSYGEGASWSELKDRNQPVGGGNLPIPLDQIADFWAPSSAPTLKLRPLIIFAHPGGGSEAFEESPVHRKNVLRPALMAGFSVASLEFRHPQASFLDPESRKECPEGDCPYPPTSDIGNAVQFFRYHARQYCIDPDNIFLVGQSRGSLALLHAIGTDDLKRDNQPRERRWLEESSKVRAVWAYQAQTTYREKELAGFVSTDTYPGLSDTYREVFVNDYIDLPYDPDSAYSRVTRGDVLKMPFLWLSYDENVTSMTSVTQQPYCSKTLDSCGKPMANFDVHDANFGVRLKNAYKQVGLGSRVTLCVNGGMNKPRNGYAGLIDFFKAHMNPALPGATAPECVTQNQPPKPK